MRQHSSASAVVVVSSVLVTLLACGFSIGQHQLDAVTSSGQLAVSEAVFVRFPPDKSVLVPRNGCTPQWYSIRPARAVAIVFSPTKPPLEDKWVIQTRCTAVLPNGEAVVNGWYHEESPWDEGVIHSALEGRVSAEAVPALASRVISVDDLRTLTITRCWPTVAPNDDYKKSPVDSVCILKHRPEGSYHR